MVKKKNFLDEAKDKDGESKKTNKKEQDSFINGLLRSLNKNDTVAYKLGNDDSPTNVTRWISTGSTLLNYCISNKKNGGIPVGKITEISGEEASGKSLMIAHALADVQKKKGIAVLLDTENAADTHFLKRVGVDVDRLIYLQPKTIEEAFTLIHSIIRKTREKFPNKDTIVMIAWDSVAATPPGGEKDADNFDPNSRIGLGAKAMSKGMKITTQTFGDENVAMVFTNQLRTKINMNNAPVYGDPYVTPYGKALPYHASVRVRLAKSKKIVNDKKEKIGVSTIATVEKTRFCSPFRKAHFNIMFDYGIDDIESWFTFLHEEGEIKKSVGWCSMPNFDEDKKFREKEWKLFLKETSGALKFVQDKLAEHGVKKYSKETLDEIKTLLSKIDSNAELSEEDRIAIEEKTKEGKDNG